MKTISMTEARKRLSELVSRAADGERFVIQRRKRPLAVLLGIAELERLERLVPMARRLALALAQNNELLQKIEAGRAHPAMAAFGLWDDAELDVLVADTYANRGRSTP